MERDTPLSIAIMALGGQGGGVLADWIVATAEASGWHAQSTSVPGVAQRTGATLYYIEMLPARGGRVPVFALMPTPGDVDVVIAAELMEAGRAILRGLVTPDKTLLVASTHRAYAVAETEKPGDAIADPRAVAEAARLSARRIIAFDLDEISRNCNTAISAPLLGALAASAALPFPRTAFEEAIKAGDKGVDASLRGFAEGFSRAGENRLPELRQAAPKSFASLPLDTDDATLNKLLHRIRSFPETLHPIIFAGIKRVVNFQDEAYGVEYLDRLESLHALDETSGGATRSYAFTTAAAKHLANALAYDDVIAVADAKTRASRFARIEKETGIKEGEPYLVAEFMHPRAQEFVGLMPAKLGARIARSEKWMRRIDRLVNKGRRVRTTSLLGFLQLRLLSTLRPLRRRLFRHAEETAHIDHWLSLARAHVTTNYGLAESIVAARRLIKGYSDTHARGRSKYDRVLSAVPHLADREDAGDWMRRLISAALKDENGDALDGALKTVKSL